MQIKNIILYKSSEQRRVVDFDLGKVNIITGESKSGKTVLIHIVDYCLGSSDCDVAYGIIRETVKWFAITVVFPDGEHLFIARKNPFFLETKNTSKVYMNRIQDGCIPIMNSLEENNTTQELRNYITAKIGIKENSQSLTNGSGDTLYVKVQHALFFCFQPQTLIAQNNQLFFHQNEPFISGDMKLSLPFLLGAVNDDAYATELKISNLRKTLNGLKRTKSEQERLYNEGYSQALSLIDEAKQFGILDVGINVADSEEAIKTLESIKDWDVCQTSNSVVGENHVLKALIDERNELRQQLGELEDSIQITKVFYRENSGFSSEINEQKARLSSIGLFNEKEIDCCPLCQSRLSAPLPSVKAINDSLKSMNSLLSEVEIEQPHLTSYLAKLEGKQKDVKDRILRLETSINELYTQETKIRLQRDLNLQRGRVLGKISLFLQSIVINKDDKLQNKIDKLENEIKVLTSTIDEDFKQHKMEIILATINSWMTSWIKDLDVEHENASVIFNLNKLTLYSLIQEDYVPLTQIGSGANWVSYHLLVLHALHKYFIQKKRPTPHFIMLDQPSQVYFPSSVADNTSDGRMNDDKDIAAVTKMYDFIFDRTEELKGNFQVIITDHAMLDNARFKAAIKEEWRNGVKLIPEDWSADIINQENESVLPDSHLS